jgi:predicted 3-demethylubiquinone-9 3-methyltransferase (glyoxalase superfamily)
MTGSHSKNNTFPAHARRGLLLAGLYAVAGAAAAQDAGERYAQTLRDAEVAQRHNTYIEQQMRSQEGEIAAIEQQIAGLEATALDVQPLVQRMFDDLERFVAADVPFLQTERAARMERLRTLMSQVEAPVSEKFRRLLEAYQIEMEYGRTMDSYRQPLPDGREADFVRLGRISLMYRTVEGDESGYWDNEQKMWVADPDHARAIEEALGIAKDEQAPDLITVPVPAPQGGRS